MEVIWSTAALEDLKKIYIQQSYTSIKKAQRVSSQIFSEAEILKNHPMAGKREPFLEKRKHPYRSLVSKIHDYKLVYHVKEDQVYIARIWDCRRNPKDMTKEIK